MKDRRKDRQKQCWLLKRYLPSSKADKLRPFDYEKVYLSEDAIKKSRKDKAKVCPLSFDPVSNRLEYSHS